MPATKVGISFQPDANIESLLSIKYLNEVVIVFQFKTHELISTGDVVICRQNKTSSMRDWIGRWTEVWLEEQLDRRRKDD